MITNKWTDKANVQCEFNGLSGKKKQQQKARQKRLIVSSIWYDRISRVGLGIEGKADSASPSTLLRRAEMALRGRAGNLIRVMRLDRSMVDKLQIPCSWNQLVRAMTRVFEDGICRRQSENSNFGNELPRVIHVGGFAQSKSKRSFQNWNWQRWALEIFLRNPQNWNFKRNFEDNLPRRWSELSKTIDLKELIWADLLPFVHWNTILWLKPAGKGTKEIAKRRSRVTFRFVDFFPWKHLSVERVGWWSLRSWAV